MEVADRTLPHDHQAERAALGAALLDAKAWNVLASTLKRSDFFRDAHVLVYDAMEALVGEGVAIDHVTLVSKLTQLGTLDECGGVAYVASLGDGLPRATNVEHYAQIVKEHARRRAVIAAADAVIAMAYDAKEVAARVVDKAVRALEESADRGVTTLVSATEAVQRYVTALNTGTAPMPMATGFPDLDQMVKVRAGDLVILAARPSVGKTALALCMAENLARHVGPVGFFSMEMSSESLAARLLSLRAGVPSDAIERGTASPAQWRRVSNAIAAPPTPLTIETSARTATEVGAWCRRIASEGGLKCVVVDYIQLMSSEQRAASDEAEIRWISRALKRLAQDMGVCVLALSQLSRAPESRRDKRPKAADLRGSGALEQDADIALLLYRAEMYDPEDQAGVAEVIVAKQRNGPTGVVPLAFVKDLAMFASLEKEMVEP